MSKGNPKWIDGKPAPPKPIDYSKMCDCPCHNPGDESIHFDACCSLTYVKRKDA